MYDIRQYVFHLGVDSQAGHFTVAVRKQQGGSYQPGDKWVYLDSGAPPVSKTLDQLTSDHACNVYAALLVDQTQPPDDEGPMVTAQPAARYFPGTLISVILMKPMLETPVCCYSMKFACNVTTLVACLCCLFNVVVYQLSQQSYLPHCVRFDFILMASLC